MKKSIFLNFAYGYGPFLRALDIAAEFNKILISKGYEPFNIVSPLVYGSRQIQIAKESHPELEIKFDVDTGAVLNKIFYKGKNYSENLKLISENYFKVEKEFNVVVEKLISEENVVMEISRNPRILSPIPLSYSSVMGLFSEFLQKSVNKGMFSGNHVDKCIKIAKRIENSQTKIFVSEPKSLGIEELCVSVPFIGTDVEVDQSSIEEGVYFYKSGINELYYLNIDFGKFKVYDSDKDPVKIKFNKNIIGIVARAGWGTISNSVILNKPLIVFPYSEGDDPEIFFNVEVLKDLDIAAIYDSALSFSENLDIAISKLPNMCSFKNQILIKYGMLNGSRYCAEVMFFDMHNVDRFLRFSDKEVL